MKSLSEFLEDVQAKRKSPAAITRKVVVTCSEQGSEHLVPILEKLKHLGSIGASREITAEDFGKIGSWDGDGWAKIGEIEVEDLDSEGHK